VLNKGVNPLEVMKILLLLIPGLSSFIVPTSLLAAVLLVFGGFSQHNEITAMKANGINLLAIFSPVLLASLLISFLLLMVNGQIEVEAQFAFRTAVKELVFKRPLAYIEPGRIIKDFEGYLMRVQKKEGEKLYGVTIFQPQGDKKSTRTITAERGEILTSPDQKTIFLNLYDGTAEESQPENPGMFYTVDFKTFEMPPIHFEKGNPGQKIEKKVRELRLDEIVERLFHNPALKEDPKIRQRYETELHKRISFAFAPFLFALIGLPIAIITRRSEAVVNFPIALSIVAVYYILFVWMETLALNRFFIPWLAMWLPDLFMLLCGALLMKRVISA